jgi:hypothetical protein
MNTATYEIEYNSPFDQPNYTGSPERRLMLAILERAILDYVGNDPREIEGASDWLFADESVSEDEFSFAWVCSELDLDAARVAEYIRAMPKRGNNRVAPWYITKREQPKEASEEAKIYKFDAQKKKSIYKEPMRKAS